MRLRPSVVFTDISPNRYVPRGATPTLIVIHSTESHNRPGTGDLRDIAEFFQTGTRDASAHVITDANGHSARCVYDSDAAWSCVAYNRASLNIEQIGQAAQGEWAELEWHETARWVAEWSHIHGIPIRRARVFAGRVIRSGVTTHHRLGPSGGGHTDPGPHYPFRRMLREARRVKRRRFS